MLWYFLQVGGEYLHPCATLAFALWRDKEPEKEPDSCDGYPSGLVGNLLEVRSVACFNVA